MNSCPLCLSLQPELYFSQNSKKFWKCCQCDLIFVDSRNLPTLSEEQQRYQHHQNDSNDPAYRAFLSRLVDPLLKYLRPGDEGLDYGCGKTKTISLLLKEKGYESVAYDPLFFPTQDLLSQQYSFITCSEVIEHFHNPHQEFLQLKRLLLPQGHLALMTGIRKEHQDFPSWHYHRDPTHVCFYSRQTFAWLATFLNFTLLFQIGDVVILRAPS